MTTTRHVYKKCPKCGKVIFTEVVMSTNVMGHGLNYEPHTEGTDPKPLAILACPKCEYTDYQSQFKEIERKKVSEAIGFDRTPTNIKYFRVGEKLKKKKKYKNALWAFLTASWYSSSSFRKECLLNVLDLIVKSFKFEELEKEEKINLLNLGLNICNQIESNKTSKTYHKLKKIGKEERFIINEYEELFDIKKPYEEKATKVRIRVENPAELVTQLSNLGLDDSEIKEKFQKMIKNRLDLKLDINKLEGYKELSKKKKIKDNELIKFILLNIENIANNLGIDERNLEFYKKYFSTEVSTLKKNLENKVNNKILTNFCIFNINEYLLSKKYEVIDYLVYLKDKKNLLKIKKECEENGHIGYIEKIARITDLKVDYNQLKKDIPQLLNKKWYSNPFYARNYLSLASVIKPIKDQKIGEKPIYKQNDKKLLLKIAKKALDNYDYYTASGIYYDLNEDSKFIDCVNKALKVGNTELTVFADDFFKGKNDKKMLIKLGNAYLKRGDSHKAEYCFRDANDKEGLIKTAYSRLKEGWHFSAKGIYENATGKEFKPNKKLLIKIGNKLLKENKVDKALDLFELADYKRGLIDAGNKALSKGESLWRVTSAFTKAKYKEGLMKLADKFLEEGQARSALKSLKSANEKINNGMKSKLVKVGLERLKENYYYDALELFKEFGNFQNLDKSLEAYAKYLVKIGHPDAFKILPELYSKDKLLELGDKLYQSGRWVTGWMAYNSAKLNEEEIDERVESIFKKKESFLKKLFSRGVN